ncbi:hypothetical protein Dalk_2124 [Desulfatibacillum aliphaticivorans]|uniref:Kelch repeat-containing protein n=1 Tax=Desulfatibacillum aliphaticivorans TaxID=218208 RepID=B8FGD8_DESAL|nr:PQQ-binding-like beta-propeller repeat protein [Desulfatibacillum aliphaticivorans]ACL03818.1 hypothetical protein Dalk_2124 [Desulfatibacillum aliphaticivorans]
MLDKEGFRFIAQSECKTALFALLITCCLYSPSFACWENGFSVETVGAFSGYQQGCASVEVDGIVYLAGGYIEHQNIYTHNLNTGQGNDLGQTLPYEMSQFAGAATEDGIIYFTPSCSFPSGGRSKLVRYNPSTNECVEISNGFPEDTARAGMIRGPDGFLYTYGGQNSSGYHGKIYRLDPSDESFDLAASVPDQLDWSTPAVFANNGLLYIFSYISQTYDVYSFDPSTGQIATASDISSYFTTNNLSVCGLPWVCEDSIFLFAHDRANSTLTLFRFNTQDNTFSNTNLNFPNCLASFWTIAKETSIFIIGGALCPDFSDYSESVYKIAPYCAPVTKPYVFMAGKPAKADEMNENFNVLLEEANSINCELEKLKSWAESMGYSP